MTNVNDFSNIPAESELRDEMTVASNEPSDRNPAYDGPMGIFEGMDDDKEPAVDSHLEADYEDRQNGGGEDETVDAGWPGDGSGTDDFEDYNQNEASDYQDE